MRSIKITNNINIKEIKEKQFLSYNSKQNKISIETFDKFVSVFTLLIYNICH